MCWEAVIAAVVCLDCRVLSFANSIVDVQSLNLPASTLAAQYMHGWLLISQVNSPLCGSAFDMYFWQNSMTLAQAANKVCDELAL